MEKKYVYIAMLILMLGSQGICQGIKLNSEIMVGNKTFVVEDLERYGSISIQNKSTIKFLEEDYRPGKSDLFPDIKFEKGIMESLFKEVFSHERLLELQNYYLIVNFYIKPTGEIIQLGFATKATSKLDLSEISKLEDLIKEKLSFEKQRVPELLNEKYLRFSIMMRFRNILNSNN